MQERWKEKRPFLKLGLNRSSVGSTISMKSQFIWKRKREPFHTPSCTISRLDASKRLQPTKDLRFENENVPVSVSLADTLNRNPEHICRKDPEELVRKFWEAIVRRAAAIWEEIQRYIPKDFELRILEFYNTFMAKRVVYFYDCYCGSFFRIMCLRFLVVYVVSSTKTLNFRCFVLR